MNCKFITVKKFICNHQTNMFNCFHICHHSQNSQFGYSLKVSVSRDFRHLIFPELNLSGALKDKLKSCTLYSMLKSDFDFAEIFDHEV